MGKETGWENEWAFCPNVVTSHNKSEMHRGEVDTYALDDVINSDSDSQWNSADEIDRDLPSPQDSSEMVTIVRE